METELLLLACAALAAGFVDAIVGGGGLIQLPALFTVLNNTAPASLLGTNKLAAVVGTSSAAIQYLRRITPPWRITLAGIVFALIGAWLGARLVYFIDPKAFKPFVFLALIGVAIYTFRNKNFGDSQQSTALDQRNAILRSGAIGLSIGLYDGLVGPGTGSFLIFLYVRALRFDFLQASCIAKLVNVTTNLSALAVFVSAGSYLGKVAVIMACSNLAGALLGSRMALTRGTAFVRKVFLFVVSALILRLGYDVIRTGSFT